MKSEKEPVRIYALSDSHQETRKTCKLLSKILEDEYDNKNVLLLHCGDIFKGIYPKNLERESYIKLKELKPEIEIILTLGNNDFGFNKEELEYLIDTVKLFSSRGIKTVCANIFNHDNTRPNWLKPYTIIKKNGLNIFLTGFCINNINCFEYGIIAKNQFEVLDEIKTFISKEKPDNVIILNHDYMPVSKNLVKVLKDEGINTDLIIGGHNHEFVLPDTNLNIYYPKTFSESMYRIDLIDNFVRKADMINSSDIKDNMILEKELCIYEKSSKLFETAAPYTLNLTKQYSKPSSLGSFLADEMKNISKSNIAFFSTGFLMKPLEYKQDDYITNYIFKKTIIARTPIKTVKLNTKELKEVFEHALNKNGYGSSNPKFLQCSSNIKIEGKNNHELKIWEIKQIYIDEKPLLNKNLKSALGNKKFICAIDSYIANGGQGFDVLKNAKKQDVIKNNKIVKIDEVLLNGLVEAVLKYKKGSEYPCFKIIETK